MANCYSCNAKFYISKGSTVSRRDSCQSCAADIRVCKNCEFYDVSSYNECREPQANRITEKEKSNFCDFFLISSQSHEKKNEKEKNLDAAKALFKKK